MKRLITLFYTFLFISSVSANTKVQNDTVINIISEAITNLNPNTFNVESYAELAYLKRTYNLTGYKQNDTVYKKQIMNNYYYDQFYLYSKLLNESAIVSDDCLHIEESTETFFPMWKKVLIYSIYPNSIKLPKNIIDLIEEYSTFDEFYGPYQMLYTIYFLKKYNYDNLSMAQKSKLSTIEDHLSVLLNNKYVNNQPWSFTKILSVKVLKMNERKETKDIDISFLTNSILEKKSDNLVKEDLKNTKYISLLGQKKFTEFLTSSTLWIFLLK